MGTLQKEKKDLAYYLTLPWSFFIEKRNDADGEYYFARVNELQCFSDGDTLEEASKNIQEALKAHLEATIEADGLIPEPINPTDYKGKIAYRTNPEKHYRIAKEAQRKHISINRLIEDAVDKILV